MEEYFDDLVRYYPPVWPGKALEVQPGDLNQIAPIGIGIGGPFPTRLGQSPFEDSPAEYYALQPHGDHPFLSAPRAQAAGGIVYFNSDVEEEDLRGLLRLLGIDLDEKKYAVFLTHAEDPAEEGYLIQMRIVSRFALSSHFDALTSEEYETFPEQKLALEALVWKFIENQIQEWGTDNSSPLEGLLGGDGDWAREKLAFGFLVENAYYGIYRIWSRAWLVTK